MEEKKKMKKMKKNDVMSNLPDPIIHSILSLLPIKEAAKTSILSKSWRHLWTSIPHLYLDRFFDTVSGREQWEMGFYRKHYEELLSIVDQIMKRTDAVCSCEISCGFFNDHKEKFDAFLLFLKEIGVKELIVNNKDDRDLYRVSLCVFALEKLEKLVLRNCELVVPQNLGVCYLKRLEIKGVTIGDEELERLVSLCGCLESLVVNDCLSLNNLKIVAPKLLSLDVCCTYQTMNISLENVAQLVNCSIAFRLVPRVGWKNAESYDANKLIKLLFSFNHVESLFLHCNNLFLKHLFRDGVPESMPLQHHLLNLKKLTIEVDLCDVNDCSFVCFLLSSCPNLQELVSQCYPSENVTLGFPTQLHLLNLKKLTVEIGYPFAKAHYLIYYLLEICPNLQELVVRQGRPTNMGNMIESDYWERQVPCNYWERQVPPKCLIHHLMKVYFYPVELNWLIGFVKFVLVNAHVLKKMSVCYWEGSKDNFGGVVKDLSLLQRASPDVVLAFKSFNSSSCFSCYSL